MDDTTETGSTVWHAGERTLQQRIGVAERMEEVGKRVIRRFLLDQHRQFYAQLPFVVAGSVDTGGDPWATLLCGHPGFLSAPTDDALRLRAVPDAADPAGTGIANGAPIALLGIELHTRRRNRLNGRLLALDDGESAVVVEESYGNCPQYIQLRDYAFVRDPRTAPNGAVERGATLDAEARRTIAAADTFFVASYSEREGCGRRVDVSHRGGKARFVRVDADGTLTIPDFAGNLFFNTLGNILLNGKAGLVFVDFVSGDLLQLTGDAELVPDSAEVAAFQGAERLWRFRARQMVRRRDALPLRWAFRDDGWSPNALMTGDWTTAGARRRAIELAGRWRPFRVQQVVEESATVRSFHLAPADGAGLAPFEAGQHLTLRIPLPGEDGPATRSYTLSAAPSDPDYRISVKRDGRASRHLHDAIRAGDLLEARGPSGGFTIDAFERRPAVLLAAGIGITPLLAMLRHIVYEGLRTRRIRPTTLVHAVRSSADRAFEHEIAALVARAGEPVRTVRVLSDVQGAQQGSTYDLPGRIDAAMLRELIPLEEADVYLCGPGPFMQAMYDLLRQLGVADARIHAEAFGPSALTRRTDTADTGPLCPAPASRSVPVVFVDSAKEARWTPETGSLLDLAEARGLQPEFSCRSGSCGTCRTRLLGGAVTYRQQPQAPIAPGEVLICCAVPAAPGEESIRLAL